MRKCLKVVVKSGVSFFFPKAKCESNLEINFSNSLSKYSVISQDTLSASIFATAGNATEKKKKLISPNVDLTAALICL